MRMGMRQMPNGAALYRYLPGTCSLSSTGRVHVMRVAPSASSMTPSSPSRVSSLLGTLCQIAARDIFGRVSVPCKVLLLPPDVWNRPGTDSLSPATRATHPESVLRARQGDSVKTRPKAFNSDAPCQMSIEWVYYADYPLIISLANRQIDLIS